MPSVGPALTGFKQTRGYFVPVGNCASSIRAYTPGTGAGGSYLPGSFAVADWSQTGAAASPYVSTISAAGAGGLLKDMGKTVVSSNRVFRKVQLVTNAVSTAGGVAGPASGAGASQPFLTGYIELSTGDNGVNVNAAAVAYMPGLL